MGSFAAVGNPETYAATQNFWHTTAGWSLSGIVRGRTCEGSVRAAAMKRILSLPLSCWVMVFSIAAADSAMAHPRLIQVSDASLCVDSMETVPITDDLEPIPIALDGGCALPEPVISI